MLKQWLAITKNQLTQKKNVQVFETVRLPSYTLLCGLYHELRSFKSLFHSLEQVNEVIITNFFHIYVSYKQIILYKTYLEYLNKTYKFYRILYNLPIRQTRTHNVSRKKKWLTTWSTTFCIKNTPLFRKLKLPQSKIQLLFFCEFINSLWFYNWWSDWFSAYKKRVKSITKNPFIKWKYDLVGLQQGRAIFFNKKNKKLKHNRKKSIVLKNTYNIGFKYGFSLFYLKRIFSVNKKGDV